MTITETAPLKTQYYDAIIVGASIAGCICALELAQKNWRVAVVEKRLSMAFYKKICTHIIHPSGVRKLARHGVFESLEKSSAQMTGMEIQYQEKSVFFPFAGKLSAANIERFDLDPALKHTLETHPNISLLMGHSVNSLLKRNRKVIGLTVLNQHQQEAQLRAPIVIGADGRHSALAKLARAKSHQQKNHRTALFSYVERIDQSDVSHVWALHQGDEYIGYFPNKRRALISWYVSDDKYREIKSDAEQQFDQLATHLNDADIQIGKRLESVMVAKETSPQSASVHTPGLALIGDAKLSADPLTGVGCAWAMSSASSLATLLGPPPSERSLPAIAQVRIQLGIQVYNLLHALRFQLPSFLMTAVSMHGKWVFNPPVYRLFAWLTKPR